MNGRPLRRLSIVTALVWMAGIMVPVVLPHAQPFDLACSDDAWRGTRTSDRIENAHATESDDHCVVCHLQRAAREAVSEPPRSLPTLDPGHARMVAARRAPLVAPVERTPARAPPATFF